MQTNATFSDLVSAQAQSQAFPRSAEVRPTGVSKLISMTVLTGAVRAFEFAVIAKLGLALALALAGASIVVAIAVLVTAMLAVGLMQLMGAYAKPALQRPLRVLPRLLGGWMLAVAAAAGIVIGTGHYDELAGFGLATLFVAGAASLIVGRVAIAARMRGWSKAGRLDRRAVIYGSGPACDALIKALSTDPASDIRICGIFDDRGSDRADAVASGIPSRGRLDDLISFARASRVDMVLLALPISAETRLMTLLQRLWVLPADIRLVATASRLKLAPRAYSYIGEVPLIALADKPIADWGLAAKWLFDKVIGALALIALAPVMAVTAIAIRLDSKGPVLFRQKRYGFNNELIEVYKFRSMFTDQSDMAAAKLVTKDDPRVTRVGRFIRKTSLDELPQLFNVMIGNLSLVGPRPHAVSAKAAGKLYDEAVDGYFARHKVKPGITGWAQINGWRGETDTEDKLRGRIEHDLSYIERWSVGFDLMILLKTPMSLLRTENAY